VLARENFPLRMMGTIIGGTAMAGSLGMATGPLAGGLIYDRFGSYGWLYIGAWALGIGAFLIALTFRPYGTGPTPQPTRALRVAAGRRIGDDAGTYSTRRWQSLPSEPQ
jgi:MFS family permease